MEGDDRFWMDADHFQTRSVSGKDLSEEAHENCTNFLILQRNTKGSYCI